MKITIGRLRSLIKEALIREALPEGISLSGLGVEEAKDIVRKFPKGMAKFGIDVKNIDSFPILGVGTHGVAFSMGDQVLKVTDDEKEAKAAKAILGLNAENIARYDAVWKFGDTGAYGLILEKLEPLSADEAKDFNDALVATGLPIWIKRAEGSWEEAERLTKEYVKSQALKKFKSYSSPEALEYFKEMNKKWEKLIKEYRLKSLFETLTDVGVDFHDYHAGNMMKRADGTLVLIDLGMSKIRGGGDLQAITEFLFRRKRI